MINKSGRLKKENSLLALTIRKIKEESKTEKNLNKNRINRIALKEKNKSYTLISTENATNEILNNNHNSRRIYSKKSVFSLNKRLPKNINIINFKNKKTENSINNNINKSNEEKSEPKVKDKNEKNGSNIIDDNNVLYRNKEKGYSNDKIYKRNNIKSLEENKSNNINIYSKKIKNKNSLLQDEINSLTNKNELMKNKLIIFLKLMREYSHKLTALMNEPSGNNKNRNDIINTLSRLNNMLNDPKLKEDVFEITQIILEDSSKNNINDNFKTELFNGPKSKVNTDFNNYDKAKNICDKGYNDNEDYIFEYNKDIEGLISKYEEKINLLLNENNILKDNKEKQKVIYDNLLNENISLGKEINDLKEELNEEKEKNEDLFIKYNNISKKLNEIENKNKILEKENMFLKKSMADNKRNVQYNTNMNKFYQRNMNKILEEDSDSSRKINQRKLNKSETQFYINTNNMLSYKDIKKDYNYFRNKNMGKIPTEPNVKQVCSFKYLNNYTCNNNNESVNDERKENMKINKNKKKINYSTYNKDSKRNNYIKNYSVDVKDSIKKEIDDLDEEIIDLQSKINEMINNNL
jgi:hypothetical protein